MKWPTEVVRGGVGQQHGVDGVVEDGEPEAAHVQTQLVRAPGGGQQPVVAEAVAVRQQLDPALAVRRPLDLLRGDHPAFLDDPAADGAGQRHGRVVRRDGTVLLADRAVPEEVLVGRPFGRPDGEHGQPGGEPVEPVRRAERGQAQAVAQSGERGLRDVAAPGRGGEEVRLVHDDQVLVPVHHVDREGDRDLLGQLTVEPEVRVRGEGGVRGDRAVHPDDLPPVEHRVDRRRVDGGQPRHQEVADGRPGAVGGQSQPDGVHAAALGQRGRRCRALASHHRTA